MAAPSHIVLLCATRRGYSCLERLIALAAGCRITVVSFPEEPWEPKYLSDIEDLARRNGAEFLRARKAGGKALQGYWERNPPDVMISVSWRYLVPPELFRRASKGAFVFHDSLLPQYRGFSPTIWSILNGEDHTGVTLLHMDEEVDAGDIVDQERVPIGTHETIGMVLPRVTDAYLRVFERNLPDLLDGTARRTPQDHGRATYCCRLRPDDCEVDWRRSTREILDLIRGYSRPYPGAFTSLGGEPLRIWAARDAGDGPRYVGRIPGRVVQWREGVGATVLTGDGSVIVREASLANGPALPAEKILNSVAVTLRSTGS